MQLEPAPEGFADADAFGDWARPSLLAMTRLARRMHSSYPKFGETLVWAPDAEMAWSQRSGFSTKCKGDIRTVYAPV